MTKETWAHRWHTVGLAVVLLISAVLNLAHLDREGFGNQYYAAAVRSMLENWHAFFFVSFDPAGFVTVDKPPLGFWIQAASAELLGFSGVSLLLPEALAGILSVAVVYVLVRRAFGPLPGLLAALFLAITPVSVVTARNNTIDSLLVLTVLLAAWAAFRATERGSLRWLVASMAILGLGFEIKMAQAYLVLPALVLLYLIAAPRPRLVRVGHLALASVVLLTISLAWPVAVDLTPKDERPYVGSTQDNSALSLALGYNGIQRLVGMRFGGAFGDGRAARDRADDGRAFDRSIAEDASQPAQGAGVPPPAAQPNGPGTPRGPVGGPGGIGENGPPGPFRLINAQLGGQASWLLPMAILGLVVTGPSLWRSRRSLASDGSAQAFLLWGVWLLSSAGFFSIAGFFHSYYLVMLGPPVAALAAAGLLGGWAWYRRGSALSWLLPVGLLATAAVQAHILSASPEWSTRLTPIVLGACLAGAMVLMVLRFWRRVPAGPRMEPRMALACGLCVASVLVAPAVWAGLEPIGGQGGGFLPSAGPVGQGRFGPGRPPGFAPPGDVAGIGAPPPPGGPGLAVPPGGPPGTDGFAFGTGRPDAARDGRAFGLGQVAGRRPGAIANESGLIAYLRANRGSERFLAATTNANAAAPIIIATGEPVMAVGGFTGGDPILTADELETEVRQGEVRFFLLGGPGGFPGGPGGRGAATAWVTSTCTQVPASDIGEEPAQLYDCANVASGGVATAQATDVSGGP